MLKAVDFYYFSPTGGTKKAGGILASELAETVHESNLAEKTVTSLSSDVVVVAAPVFAGRIPAIVSESIAKLTANAQEMTGLLYDMNPDGFDAWAEAVIAHLMSL